MTCFRLLEVHVVLLPGEQEGAYSTIFRSAIPIVPSDSLVENESRTVLAPIKWCPVGGRSLEMEINGRHAQELFND